MVCMIYEGYMTPFRLCFGKEAVGFAVWWEGFINVSAPLSSQFDGRLWIPNRMCAPRESKET